MLFRNHCPARLQKTGLVFSGVLLLDQSFKNLLFANGLIEKNFGALFSIAVNNLYLWILSVMFAVLAMNFLRKNRHPERFAMPLALIFSGMLSNSIDRFRFGFIIDYIFFFNLFIFNLADVAILCGVTLFIWQIIRE